MVHEEEKKETGLVVSVGNTVIRTGLETQPETNLHNAYVSACLALGKIYFRVKGMGDPIAQDVDDVLNNTKALVQMKREFISHDSGGINHFSYVDAKGDKQSIPTETMGLVEAHEKRALQIIKALNDVAISQEKNPSTKGLVEELTKHIKAIRFLEETIQILETNLFSRDL